jgi:hypothetical protein
MGFEFIATYVLHIASQVNMCNPQNRWVSGLCPFSGIKKLEHDVSETGSGSVLR